MKHKGHPYRAGLRGRSMTIKQERGAVISIAHLQCSRCPAKADRHCKSDQTPHQLDAAFKYLGWRLDPHVCPDCQKKPSQEEKAVTAAKPSAAAMKAQVQMIARLNDHFDTTKGAYSTDWNDQRVAKETGLALDLVVEYRRTCFGELKEPAEIAAIRADICALEGLQAESQASIAQGIAELRGKLAKVAERFAA